MCDCVRERVRVQGREQQVESEGLTSGQAAHAAAASARHSQSADASTARARRAVEASGCLPRRLYHDVPLPRARRAGHRTRLKQHDDEHNRGLAPHWGEGKKKSILESELKTKAKGPLRIWL